MSIKAITGVLIASLFSTAVLAKVTPEQAAQLGDSLTPLGAEKAANAAGTIPAWTGGITTPPANYKVGMHHPDPFAAEKPVLVIDQSNVAQYQQQLSEGQVAMIKTYPTFKINVYPTHRTASYPAKVYNATKENATRAELINDGNGLKGAAIGIPFPIPQNGLEVIWNHITRYRGESLKREAGQAVPTRSGDYTLIKLKEEVDLFYSKDGVTPEQVEDKNLLFYFKQQITAPARLAGESLLVHEFLDQIKEPRQAWVYNPGQQRVRRAPNVAYDAPGTASDGLRTNDNFDMFNGAPDRYNWKLVGKKELYIPYNSYQLHSDKLSYDDILKAGHINPEYLRYELHRVWVVEATLKEGMRHIYNKRVFYIDEDSWQVAVVDHYDSRDQLWRVGEAYSLNYYEVPVQWTTLEVFYDLQSGRYLAMGLDNQEAMYDFNNQQPESYYTPAALRREGRR